MPSAPDPTSGAGRLPEALAADSVPSAAGGGDGGSNSGLPSRDRSAAERRLQQADDVAEGPMPGDAVRHYRELLELEPEHIEGRLHFARLLERLEEAGEAVDVLSD